MPTRPAAWRAATGSTTSAPVTGHNADPVAPGAGSAVFVHLWRRPRWPTAGCIAFRRPDLEWILARWRPGSRPMIRERGGLSHAPGQAQVDFGETLGEISGVQRKLHYFAMALPPSDAFFVKAYQPPRAWTASTPDRGPGQALPFDEWTEVFGSERLTGAILDRLTVNPGDRLDSGIGRIL